MRTKGSKGKVCMCNQKKVLGGKKARSNKRGNFNENKTEDISLKAPAKIQQEFTQQKAID